MQLKPPGAKCIFLICCLLVTLTTTTLIQQPVNCWSFSGIGKRIRHGFTQSALVQNPLVQSSFFQSLPGFGLTASAGGRQQTRSAAQAKQQQPSKADYEAMCFLKRDPTYSADPTLHFFSGPIHRASMLQQEQPTPDGAAGGLARRLGCQDDLEIPLNISNIISKEYTSSSSGILLNQTQIEHDLLWSGLYQRSLTTYFIVHGFMSDWSSDNWMCRLKDMILNNTQANVFIVDWSGGAKPMMPLDYGKAVTNTQYVGQVLGAFIRWLLERTNTQGATNFNDQLDASDFHLIGHSLGAHISGFVGYSLEGSVGRITGLDPAGPCFSGAAYQAESGFYSSSSATRRLSAASAKQVYAIHTDSSLFGLNENCAHYNVYVNGGAHQPQCSLVDVGARLGDIFSGNLGNLLACNHLYSHEILNSFLTPTQDADNEDIVPESPASSTFEGAGRRRERPSSEKCYPVAHRCRSWDAFKSGECGFCLSDIGGGGGRGAGGETSETSPAAATATDCVYIGLLLDEVGSSVGEEAAAAQNATSKENLDAAAVAAASGAEAAPREAIVNSTTNAADDAEKKQQKSDDKTNGEDDGGESNSKDDEEAAAMLELISRGQHFIKSGADFPYCLYHYQVIIATRASGFNASQYYVQVPLHSSGKLVRMMKRSSEGTGADRVPIRLRDRLVQVSHLSEPNSWANTRISEQFLSKVNTFYQINQNSRAENDAMKKQPLNYYTALITFKTTDSPDDCTTHNDDLASSSPGRSGRAAGTPGARAGTGTGEIPDSDDDSILGQGRSVDEEVEQQEKQRKEKGWSLCRPLRHLRELKVWASSQNLLEQVRWLALNYLSAPKLSQRLTYSHLFVNKPSSSSLNQSSSSRSAGYRVASRKESESYAPSLKELDDPAQANSGNPITSLVSDTLVEPVDCLMSSLNPLTSGSASNNYKCDNSKAELTYSITLSPLEKKKR